MSKKTKDPWVRRISVSDPLRHKKGYTLYKVTSKVFPKNSVEATSEVTVWKRYNDFKKLHKALFTIHQNLYLKDTFPSFAKARFFGRFDDTVIEERRLSALNLLQFAANHPPLFTSQVFVKFFEGGYVLDETECVPQSEEKCLESVLLPMKSDRSPVFLDSNHSNSGDNSPHTEPIESSNNKLGGIWQHHQVPDNISVGSHQTEDDEDDRTTFTDDESSASGLSLNLAEFDPLAGSDSCTKLDKSLSNQDEICNSWLLSALQFCNNPKPEKDLETNLEFPKPFIDLDNSDDLVTPLNECQSMDTVIPGSKKSEQITFTNPVTTSNSSAMVMEISDAFSKTVKNPKTVEEDSISKYDNFALTPNEDKNKLQHQPSYLACAAKSVCSAQEAESNGNFSEAFDFYKKAIDILLQGSQKDNSPDAKDVVRKKLLLYLMRAEEIYENKLPKWTNTSQRREEVHKSFSTYPMENKVSGLRGCVQDLKKYKVLGVLSRVLLVLDVDNNSTHIIKTLYKSSNPQNSDVPNLVPQNIPFMVQLAQMYETSYALFLILEHATGGRLWDYVSSYLQRSPLSPCTEGTYLYVEHKSKSGLSNVYSGKKIHDKIPGVNQSIFSKSSETLKLVPCNESLNAFMDSDLIASKNCPPSYVALFKRYAATVHKEDNVALAKYHTLSQVSVGNDTIPKNDVNSSLISLSNGLPDGKEKEIAMKENQENPQNKPLQPHTFKNRLSSTGSLETALSKKTCLFEAFNAMDDVVFQASCNPVHLPESCIYFWAAEIIVALESLHKLGIIWMDLHPDNILLGTEGHILLTYQSQWNCVDHIINESAKENFYCAPEVGSVFPVTSDCDWWSLGVILFELLTARSLVSCHPTGITRHTALNIPADISPEAKDLLIKLLQYNASERLGSGIYGVEEIKSHPFFRTVDWESLYQL